MDLISDRQDLQQAGLEKMKKNISKTRIEACEGRKALGSTMVNLEERLMRLEKNGVPAKVETNLKELLERLEKLEK